MGRVPRASRAEPPIIGAALIRARTSLSPCKKLQEQARQGRYTGAPNAHQPLSASSLFTPRAGAPLWTLEGLRGADPVLGMAILMTVGVVLADALHRLTRLPRACGYMLVGRVAC